MEVVLKRKPDEAYDIREIGHPLSMQLGNGPVKEQLKNLIFGCLERVNFNFIFSFISFELYFFFDRILQNDLPFKEFVMN